MRKIRCFWDNLFWYILYMLPIILLLINWCCGATSSFSSVFTNLGLSIVNDNIILTALIDLFGSSSQIFPLFTSNEILIYLTYFIGLMIVHIFVDVLLFIPRWCHSMFDKGGKEC